MIRSLLLLCCLLVGAWSEDQTMLQRLQTSVDQAEAELKSERQRIETNRRKLLEEIDQARAAVRDAELALLNQQQLFETEIQAARDRETQVEMENSLAPYLVRQLAGEGLPVAPGMVAEDLLRVWPQIEAKVRERLTDLGASIPGSLVTDEILNRSGHAQQVPVWQWGAAQRIALGDDTETRGICLRLDDGHWQVAGPIIDEIPKGFQVVDVTGNLAATRPEPTGALALMQRAGPFAWPILGLALLGLAIIGDRLVLLWRWKTPKDLVDRVIADMADPARAISHVASGHAASARIIKEILSFDPALSESDREQRAGAALVEVEVPLQRGLRLLAVLAAAAPLLGLLGTVTGMITSFRALDIGGGGNAGQLSAGIGEALLTTEFGLIVAIPILLAHALFARDAQRRRSHAESAAMRLLAAQGKGVQE